MILFQDLPCDLIPEVDYYEYSHAKDPAGFWYNELLFYLDLDFFLCCICIKKFKSAAQNSLSDLVEKFRPMLILKNKGFGTFSLYWNKSIDMEKGSVVVSVTIYNRKKMARITNSREHLMHSCTPEPDPWFQLANRWTSPREQWATGPTVQDQHVIRRPKW